MTDAPARIRVALDLASGDRPPDAVVDGALLVADQHPEIEVLLVGNETAAAEALAARSATGRLVVVPAAQSIGPSEHAVHAVRAKRNASVRVAARLVRDGEAHAMVSAGPVGVTLAAAAFVLDRLPGATRLALAVVVPAGGNRVVLLDTSGAQAGGADVWAQYTLAGTAFATTVLGVDSPRVGLLAPADDPGLGAAASAWVHGQPAARPVRFVGTVSAAGVLAGAADVVVTDGFTGQVVADLLGGAADPQPASADAGRADQGRADEAGGVLLGQNGVVVVARQEAQAVAAALRTAAGCVRGGLVPVLAETLTGLVAARRERAGLGAAP